MNPSILKELIRVGNVDVDTIVEPEPRREFSRLRRLGWFLALRAWDLELLAAATGDWLEGLSQFERGHGNSLRECYRVVQAERTEGLS